MDGGRNIDMLETSLTLSFAIESFPDTLYLSPWAQSALIERVASDFTG